MKKSKLLDALKAKRSEIEKIEKAAEKRGDVVINEEEEEKVVELEKEIGAIERQLKRLEARQAAALNDPEEDDEEEGEDPPVPQSRAIKPNPAGKVAAEPKKEKVFRSFGEQLQAIATVADPMAASDKRQEAANKLKEVRAATGSNESVDSEGGFLVEKDFSKEILKRAYDTSVIASRCKKMSISSGANGIKIPVLDETSRATGSRLGGVRLYWKNEADTATASKPKLAMLELQLKKLLGFWYATDEILADASIMDSLARSAFVDELAFMIDDACIRGNGGNEPQGILNANCLVSVAKETGQAAATLVFENVLKMRSRLYAKSRASAVVLVNQDVEPQLSLMNLGVGTGGSAVYLPAGGAADRPNDRLFGMPVLPVEYCATLGTQGDIIMADFSQYLLIDKGNVEQDSSIHVNFLYDEQVFRIKHRVDGQPIWRSALTPYKGSNTQSPFVVLDTRS